MYDPTYLAQSMGRSVRKKRESKAKEIVRLTLIVMNSDAMKHLPVLSTDFSKPKQRRVAEDLRFLCCCVPVLVRNSQPEVTSRHGRDGRWPCTTPEVMGSGTGPHLEHKSGTSPVSLFPCSRTVVAPHGLAGALAAGFDGTSQL